MSLFIQNIELSIVDHIRNYESEPSDLSSIIMSINFRFRNEKIRCRFNIAENIHNDCWTIINHIKNKLVKEIDVYDENGIITCETLCSAHKYVGRKPSCYDCSLELGFSPVKLISNKIEINLEQYLHDFRKDIDGAIENFIVKFNKDKVSRIFYVVYSLTKHPFNIPDYLIFMILRFYGISVNRIYAFC
jgi:hypothetical protein